MTTAEMLVAILLLIAFILVPAGAQETDPAAAEPAAELVWTEVVGAFPPD